MKQRQLKMDIIDIDKLIAMRDMGFSIRKLSIEWNLPYASLYRVLKKVEREKNAPVRRETKRRHVH